LTNRSKGYFTFFGNLFLPGIYKETRDRRKRTHSFTKFDDSDIAKFRSFSTSPSPTNYKFNIEVAQEYAWASFRILAKEQMFPKLVDRQIDVIPLEIKYDWNKGGAANFTWYYAPLLKGPARVVSKSKKPAPRPARRSRRRRLRKWRWQDHIVGSTEIPRRRNDLSGAEPGADTRKLLFRAMGKPSWQSIDIPGMIRFWCPLPDLNRHDLLGQRILSVCREL
jgi:hypothetical protein